MKTFALTSGLAKNVENIEWWKEGEKEDGKVAKTASKCVVERECERVTNEIDEETKSVCERFLEDPC